MICLLCHRSPAKETEEEEAVVDEEEINELSEHLVSHHLALPGLPLLIALHTLTTRGKEDLLRSGEGRRKRGPLTLPSTETQGTSSSLLYIPTPLPSVSTAGFSTSTPLPSMPHLFVSLCPSSTLPPIPSSWSTSPLSSSSPPPPLPPPTLLTTSISPSPTCSSLTPPYTPSPRTAFTFPSLKHRASGQSKKNIKTDESLEYNKGEEGEDFNTRTPKTDAELDDAFASLDVMFDAALMSRKKRDFKR